MNRGINKIIKLVLFISFIWLIYELLSDLVPLLQQVIVNASDESKMIDYIHAYGAKGVPVLMGLQFLQVFIPFLPAAPIQMLTGLCYGVWYGTLICLVGFVTGHFLIFCAIRRFGSKFSFIFEKLQKKNTSSGNSANKLKRPEIMVFFLYLIPAIPNGALPFLFAETKISYHRYLLSVITAAIPSILVCSWFGERISSGDFKSAYIIFGVIIIVALLLLIFKNKILRKIS